MVATNPTCMSSWNPASRMNVSSTMYHDFSTKCCLRHCVCVCVCVCVVCLCVCQYVVVQYLDFCSSESAKKEFLEESSGHPQHHCSLNIQNLQTTHTITGHHSNPLFPYKGF